MLHLLVMSPTIPPKQSKVPWWKTGVIYQIYPRSFQDSNGDGIGDLPGILSRLDYLADLGVDALWLSPINPSPMYDFGYDVSDYRGIAPEFGTLEDFQALLAEAHRRGIRILLDLVLNHTSHLHPWFVESSSRRDNPKRHWYIWHDGKPTPSGRRAPPNNWLGVFGGRAWEWHEPTGQFYLHSFLPQQPDVNWRNPELRAAMFAVMRYWLELGVDGFRLDVVNWFIKDDRWRDNPLKLFGGLRPYEWQHHLYDKDRPETLEIMREIRQIADAYGGFTVGEVFTPPPGNPELVAAYYDRGRGLHMAFNFAFTYCPWKAESFAKAIERFEKALSPDDWPNYTLSNHDQPRSFSRYGNSLPRAKVAAAMLLTLRGTPFLYYGEEIGMSNTPIPRTRLQDPLGRKYWPFHPGRDPVRTPMQWSAEPNAGFSSTEPWLPVNPLYPSVNVAAQQNDPASLLHWYKALLRLRKSEPALRLGSYERLPAEQAVLCYERQLGEDRILVALNFSSTARPLHLPPEASWKVLLATPAFSGENLSGTLLLAGDGVLLLKATA